MRGEHLPSHPVRLPRRWPSPLSSVKSTLERKRPSHQSVRSRPIILNPVRSVLTCSRNGFLRAPVDGHRILHAVGISTPRNHTSSGSCPFWCPGPLTPLVVGAGHFAFAIAFLTSTSAYIAPSVSSHASPLSRCDTQSGHARSENRPVRIDSFSKWESYSSVVCIPCKSRWVCVSMNPGSRSIA